LDPSYTAFDPFYSYPDMYPDLIEDSVVYPYVIEFWPTCNVFKKGHRIRLSVSGSDFPHFMPILRPSDNTIVIDSTHPANIEFDLINKENEGKDWKWIGSPKHYLSGKSSSWNANQAANNYLMGYPEPEDNPADPVNPDNGNGNDNASLTSSEADSADSSGGTFCFISSAAI
jgi:hypothetical protein